MYRYLFPPVLAICCLQLFSCAVEEPGEELLISVDEMSRQQLLDERARSLALGVNREHGWVDANWELRGDTADWRTSSGRAEIRLKGDYTDHLEGEQWSYRVKLKGDGRFLGMKSFSLVKPVTRWGVNEYFYHRLLRDQDVLTPRYDFALVRVGPNEPRWYAVEEHFRKEMVESLNRRESPILKFDETAFWNRYIDPLKDELGGLPIAPAAVIQCFTPSKLEEDEVFARRFVAASGLLENLRRGSRPVSELIDVDAWARYLALTDLTEAYHGLAWHNVRFYFNPLTGKLEPVAYDGFMETGAYNWLERENIILNGDRNTGVLRRITQSPEVMERHRHWLEHYTGPGWLDSVLVRMQPELEIAETRVLESDTALRWLPSELLERAASLRASLDLSPLNDPGYQEYLVKRMEGMPVRSDLSVQAWSDGDSIWFEGYHWQPLQVTGIGESELYLREFDQAVSLPAWDGAGRPLRLALKLDHLNSGASNFFYRDPHSSGDSLYQAAVIRHLPPPYRSVRSLPVASEQLTWNGEVRIEELMQIEGDVVIASGSTIFLERNGGLVVQGSLSGSDFQITGKPGNQGLTVFGDVAIEDADVANLEPLDTLGWVLMGGVNLVNGQVKLRDLRIAGGRSEDALNTFGCVLDIQGLEIHDAHGDAFDTDFCQGEIADLKLLRSFNDALDLSGSVVRVSGLAVEKAGDKGISVGEGSEVKWLSGWIEDAVVGISVKDGSRLEVESGCQLRSCRLGLAAFRKKPEYLPPSILDKGLQADGIVVPGLFENGAGYEGSIQNLQWVDKADLESLGY